MFLKGSQREANRCSDSMFGDKPMLCTYWGTPCVIQVMFCINSVSTRFCQCLIDLRVLPLSGELELMAVPRVCLLLTYCQLEPTGWPTLMTHSFPPQVNLNDPAKCIVVQAAQIVLTSRVASLHREACPLALPMRFMRSGAA